jgi:hypothetical protein
LTGSEIAEALRRFGFRYKDERQLQGGIAEALGKLGVANMPEFRLSPTARVDFYVLEGQVGIEVKTADSQGGASLSAVTRQLWRYAKSDKISALILVTTRSKHMDLPSEILGKPVHVVYLSSFL